MNKALLLVVVLVASLFSISNVTAPTTYTASQKIAVVGPPAADSDTITPEADIAQARNASLRIAQSTMNEVSMCSGTAIGPHAILTASHCEEPSDALLVQPLKGDDVIQTTITGRIRDGADHTILLVTCIFASYANLSLTDPLAQGEEVYSFGNPGKLSDVYRKGYIAGVNFPYETMFSSGPKAFILDMNGFFGDSGSAAFNASGQVVLVLSAIANATEEGASVKFDVAYPFAFTQAQLDSIK